jgi:hypothetical protein
LLKCSFHRFFLFQACFTDTIPGHDRAYMVNT